MGLQPKEEFQSGAYGCRTPAGGPTWENTCNGVPLLGVGGARLWCGEATISAHLAKAAAVTKVQSGTGSFQLQEYWPQVQLILTPRSRWTEGHLCVSVPCSRVPSWDRQRYGWASGPCSGCLPGPEFLPLRPCLSLQRCPGPICRALGALAGRRDPKEPDGEDQQEGPCQAVLPAQPGSARGQAPMSQHLLSTRTSQLSTTESSLMG